MATYTIEFTDEVIGLVYEFSGCSEEELNQVKKTGDVSFLVKTHPDYSIYFIKGNRKEASDGE